MLLAVVAIGAIAGCGGSGDNSNSTDRAATLGAAQFTAKGNAICRRANDEVAAMKAPTDAASAFAFVGRLKTITDRMLQEFLKLSPPVQSRSEFNAFMDQLRKGSALVTRMAEAAQSGDLAEVQAVSKQANALDPTFNAAARALGVDECAKDVSPQS
jgi:hypothetical protein